MQEAGFACYPQLEPNSKSMMKTKLTPFVAILAAALFGIGCASTEPAFVSNGLVAYYPFNGNADDESGNGNHGKVYDLENTEDRNGIPNSAYKFSGGESAILVENDRGQFNLNQLSLSVWVALGNSNIYQSIIHKLATKNTNEDNYMITVNRPDTDGRIIYFGVEQADEADFGVNANFTELDKYIHIAATYGEHELKIYLNGVLNEKTQAPAKVLHTGMDMDLLIGSSRYYAGGVAPKSFNGSIDDVRIYNRALSAEEVKALYDLEKPKGK
jgi:hypothetical protein